MCVCVYVCVCVCVCVWWGGVHDFGLASCDNLTPWEGKTSSTLMVDKEKTEHVLMKHWWGTFFRGWGDLCPPPLPWCFPAHTTEIGRISGHFPDHILLRQTTQHTCAVGMPLQQTYRLGSPADFLMMQSRVQNDSVSPGLFLPPAVAAVAAA